MKAIGVNRFYIYPGTHDFDNIIRLSKLYDCETKFISNLQSYVILRQGVLTDKEIERECHSLETQYNDPIYFKNVRSWRFR